MPKATNTHLEYVILFASPLQQWLHERTLMLRYTYNASLVCVFLNLLKPTGYVMHHQFNIQQLYALPTLYLCVLHLYEDKQRLVPLTA